MTSPALQACLDAIDREFAEPRLVVNSVPRGNGHCFWEVKGWSLQAVEREAAKLAGAPGIEAAFAEPFQRDGLWCVQGFTRVVPIEAQEAAE